MNIQNLIEQKVKEGFSQLFQTDLPKLETSVESFRLEEVSFGTSFWATRAVDHWNVL